MPPKWRLSEHGIPITVTQSHDPAYKLLTDGVTSTPKVHRNTCYICEDPEFAQMGLPLCRPCPQCTGDSDQPKGHIAADDVTCDECGYDEQDAYERGEVKP